MRTRPSSTFVADMTDKTPILSAALTPSPSVWYKSEISYVHLLADCYTIRPQDASRDDWQHVCINQWNTAHQLKKISNVIDAGRQSIKATGYHTELALICALYYRIVRTSHKAKTLFCIIYIKL